MQPAPHRGYRGSGLDNLCEMSLATAVFPARPAARHAGDRALSHRGARRSVERCDDCGYTRRASNSCPNRHCPNCQWTAAQSWLEAWEAELLPVPYVHVVFTPPAAIGAMPSFSAVS